MLSACRGADRWTKTDNPTAYLSNQPVDTSDGSAVRCTDDRLPCSVNQVTKMQLTAIKSVFKGRERRSKRTVSLVSVFCGIVALLFFSPSRPFLVHTTSALAFFLLPVSSGFSFLLLSLATPLSTLVLFFFIIIILIKGFVVRVDFSLVVSWLISWA